MIDDGRTGVDFSRAETREEHVRLLRKKLVEEAVEYAIEPSPDELADVLEAIVALCHVDLNVSFLSVSAIRRAKAEQRGGFHGGWLMRSITA